MMILDRTALFAFLCLTLIAISKISYSQEEAKPNVLFISVDDWNDWVGVLGHNQGKTPNMDRLASQGLLFTNAYCSAPLCNPSRASVFSGKRPSTTGIYSNNEPLRYNHPDIVTLPQHFRNNGYKAHGGGKLFHDPAGFVDMVSWDKRFFWSPHAQTHGGWEKYSMPPDPEVPGRYEYELQKIAQQRNFIFAPVDNPDSDMPDYKVVSWASSFLAKKYEKPFFLSVGLFRPHVPWFAPKKYFDMYPLEKIKLPPYKKDDLNDVPKISKKRARQKGKQHEKVLKTNNWEKAIQGYLACISFSDAQLGRLLDAFESSQYKDNTIVVLWSDHGYHLGEKDHWHKRALWQRATHIPLIFKVPGITKAGKCERPVDLTCLYPTLSELCGLPSRNDLDGTSIAPLLKKPDAKWDIPAITTNYKDNHAISTEEWRYIRYEDQSEELYNLKTDPNEWTNLAGDKKHQQVKNELARWLPKINVPPARGKQDGLKYDFQNLEMARKKIILKA